MNIRCLNCKNIRMQAFVRPGSAVARFLCPYQHRVRAYLLPGDQLPCYEAKQGKHLGEDMLEPNFEGAAK